MVTNISAISICVLHVPMSFSIVKKMENDRRERLCATPRLRPARLIKANDGGVLVPRIVSDQILWEKRPAAIFLPERKNQPAQSRNIRTKRR